MMGSSTVENMSMKNPHITMLMTVPTPPMYLRPPQIRTGDEQHQVAQQLIGAERPPDLVGDPGVHGGVGVDPPDAATLRTAAPPSPMSATPPPSA